MNSRGSCVHWQEWIPKRQSRRSSSLSDGHLLLRLVFLVLWMESSTSDAIVIEDSDDEDVEILADRTSNEIFCQICEISLTNQSVEARQAHYEQHFADEVGEEEPIVEGTIL